MLRAAQNLTAQGRDNFAGILFQALAERMVRRHEVPAVKALADQRLARAVGNREGVVGPVDDIGPADLVRDPERGDSCGELVGQRLDPVLIYHVVDDAPGEHVVRREQLRRQHDLHRMRVPDLPDQPHQCAAGRVREPPRAMWVAGSLCRQIPADAATSQLGEAGTSALPLFPGDGAQPSPDPLIKCPQHRRCLTEAKVAAPSLEIDGQLLDDLYEASAARAPR